MEDTKPPPITCPRQRRCRLLTQRKLPHVQSDLLQTLEDTRSLEVSAINGIEPCPDLPWNATTRIAAVCRGVVDPEFSGTQQPLGVIDNASCLLRSAAVWPLCEEIEGDETFNKTPIERKNDPHHLHDMLCSVSAFIVTSSPIQNGATSRYEQHNDTLQKHYSIRKNLVLDSLHPDTPHIVITPVEEAEEDYYVSWRNRIDFQWAGYLAIPQQDVSRTCLFTLNNAVVSKTACSEEPPNQPASPRLFLNTSWFDRMIKTAGGARLAPHVKRVVQRHQFRATAFVASGVAATFRKRYDDPKYLCSIEMPFSWVDPAEPILRYNAYYRGVLIIDSPSPFTVPHIMISAPPPQDFRVSWGNATNNPQDGGFGRYLVVPSESLDYINMLQSPCGGLDSNGGNEADLSQGSSPPGSPFPETPIGDHDSDFFYIQRPEDITDDSDENDLEVECLTTEEAGCPKFFLYDGDDEEDCLPPFDEWYQNIAARAQSMNIN